MSLSAWENEGMGVVAETLGLYLSVPFCRAKCSFCNFASGVGTAQAVERYVGSLRHEIGGLRHAAAQSGLEVPKAVDTIYLGGGTPSLLEAALLRQIFAAIRSAFDVRPEAEVTLEAAPGQIEGAILATALDCGVNRVSLGVQSFVDREAQAVGRSHTEASCQAEFARLRAAGVTNVGADLIAGLPYQTEASWAHSLDIAVSSGLDHLSVYMLEVDEESRLGREVLGGGARLHAPAVPSDELTATLYESACERLPYAGFQQYEISNFAQAGKRSQHNLKYWLRDPYLGFGLDAHSMLRLPQGGALRWANAEEFSAYDGNPRIKNASPATRREVFEEIVFLGLRLSEGLAWADVQGFPNDWVDDLRGATATLEEEGLMRSSGQRLWLTSSGRMLSSSVFGELLAGVAA